ncbi:MAG: hypothetical protein JWO09_3456 [Bacteroidetes bacterium]|nr:hypothetical protein [Bacteroidota bacterium]
MDKKIVKDLEGLFSVAPPDTLRRSVNQVFYSYIINNKALPDELETIAEDFSMLVDFLEKADQQMRTTRNKKV